MSKIKIFVDTDIILDLLSQREPFYNPAALLFSLADQKKLTICVSSLTFSNLNYILNRTYSAAETKRKLFKFKTLVTVLAVDDKIIELALSSEFHDIEDAIQYYTAMENNIQLLLTRNIKDYKKATISVMTADQYLKEI